MEGKLQYKDLDLKGLREKCGIDFAHYTFKKGMCSCCYGPSDFPARYWHKGIIKNVATDNVSYIMFKNADNGSGRVTRNDYLSDKRRIYIAWKLSDEQLDDVCRELKNQVGSEFDVIKPESNMYCIELKRKDVVDEN